MMLHIQRLEIQSSQSQSQSYITTDSMSWSRAQSGTFDQRFFFFESYCPVFRVRVRVTLQLMVSQSVCLGVEPNLGLLTRDIIFFF
jgi:hypothetical protein